jgi:TolB-like protein
MEVILKTKACLIFRLVSIAFVILTVLSNAAHAAEAKRVAVLPFKINAEKDLSFLREGIRDMLTSRLTKEGEVLVISRPETDAALGTAAGAGAVTEPLARQVGAKLNADFVVFGSLTVVGNSISMDAKMLDITGSKPPMAFFTQSQDLGAIIPKVDEFAADINEKVLGQAVVARKGAEAQPKAAEKPDIYKHPEKLLQEGGLAERETEGPSASPFVKSDSRETSMQDFWKSPGFKLLFNGLALGDVDRDGKIETVVITPDTVIIFRSDNGRLAKTAEIAADGSRELIGVDIADINGNGVPEIFVTALNALRTVPSSFVLEYDGKNYARLIDDSRWFYRVADTPNRGKILLGQKIASGTPFGGSIYEMSWQQSDYLPGEKLATPRDTNVMGMAIGDVLNNQQENAVAYDPTNNIQIMDAANGNEVWKSSDRYGGSDLFVAGPKKDQGDVVNPIYLPMRLVVKAVKNDDKPEVIVVKNYEVAEMKFERFRKFTDAQIEGLAWDGLGLASKWVTRKISGCIRDYAVGDFDNDGREEIVAVVVTKTGSIITTEPKSSIIAYELGSK